jgi:hypothetical protein
MTRAAAGVGPAVVAAVHRQRAASRDLSGGVLSQAELFREQAAATVPAIAVVARPGRLVWRAAALLGAPSLLAVVVTTYLAVPEPRRFRRVDGPMRCGDTILAAVAAGVGGLALVLAAARATRRVRLLRTAASFL